MPEAAKLEWTRLAADLAHLGTLTGLDTGLMTAWCCCWARWQEAEKKLLEMGAVVRGTSGGAIISPYFSISQRCLK
jgi:P27 family predicted phage terminase small subunit